MSRSIHHPRRRRLPLAAALGLIAPALALAAPAPQAAADVGSTGGCTTTITQASISSDSAGKYLSVAAIFSCPPQTHFDYATADIGVTSGGSMVQLVPNSANNDGGVSQYRICESVSTCTVYAGANLPSGTQTYTVYGRGWMTGYLWNADQAEDWATVTG